MHVLATVLVVSLVWATTGRVFADNATSTNFMTHNTITDHSGGVATSSNFSSVAAGTEIGGESTSTSFLVDTGPMYYDTFTAKSSDWHWYDDETNETPSVSLAPENVAPSSVNNLNTIKLRLTVNETAGIGAAGIKFALQYSTSSDFSSGAAAVVEQGACTPTSRWCYANGAGLDNGRITTALLSDADPCVASVGSGCGTHNESGLSTSTATQGKNTATEYEFTIQESGAAPNTVYFFRAYNVIGDAAVSLLNASSTYPSLSTQGTNLTFTIGGIATSTPAGGVTTDITTTSTAVPFGTLGLNVPVAGAQELTVSTNATQGYEIYAYQQQGLLGDVGGQLDPIGGTNASPVSWSSGCAATSTSCYGYHTNESVLSGGSTRFAADDTYASFSSNPAEIAYSAGPAANKVTDIVYKVVAEIDQAAGDYTGGVVYIVVPTF